MESGIYIHFPFCLKKCGYCGFYSEIIDDNKSKNYIECLLEEINIQSANAKGLINKSIYFGGGTPSLMKIKSIEAIFNSLYNNFIFDKDTEVTLEANPAAITKLKTSELANLPINRISLGFQSFDESILKFLGRKHKVTDNYKTYNNLINAGFSNISVDLMFAVPNQSVEQWINSLEKVIELNPKHISIYCFSFDPGTQFTKLLDQNKIIPATEDIEARMFNIGIKKLEQNGYIHYEISNFAKPGYESRHNRLYWKNMPYVGLGASAYSYLNRQRYCAPANTSQYIDKITNRQDIYINKESLTDENSLRETAALNIRLINEGICLGQLKSMYPNLSAENILGNTLRELINKGLMFKADNGSYRLSEKGVLFSDLAASHLV